MERCSRCPLPGGLCRRMLPRWGFAMMKTRCRPAPLTNGDACCLPPAGTVRVTPRGVNHGYNPFCVDGFSCMHAPLEKPSINKPHTYVVARTTATTRQVRQAAASHARKPTGYVFVVAKTQHHVQAVHKSLHCVTRLHVSSTATPSTRRPRLSRRRGGSLATTTSRGSRRRPRRRRRLAAPNHWLISTQC